MEATEAAMRGLLRKGSACPSIGGDFLSSPAVGAVLRLRAPGGYYTLGRALNRFSKRVHMAWFEIIVSLLGLAAVFSYLNERLLKLQSTIGVMLLALVVSVAGLIVEALGGVSWHKEIVALLTEFDFSSTLLDGLLCFLLFAGALHIPIRTLEREKWLILALTILGTMISTFVTGTVLWLVLGLAGWHVKFIHALLFGAIIAPTDPIATLAILKSAGLPKRLETLINGESLFNDGVAVVLFTVIGGIAFGGHEPAFREVSFLLGQEVLGGALFGLLMGAIALFMLKGVQEHSSEVLITLSVVAGGYALAKELHVSGPIATVVVGLIVGNYSRRRALDESGWTDLDTFWRLMDEMLNVVLFLMIGFLVLLGEFSWAHAAGGLLAILMVLFGRWVSVSASIGVFRIHERLDAPARHLITLLTWGGLRGALSLAMALSLPAGDVRDLILAMTYAVVAFSVVVQGLTVSRMFSQDELELMVEVSDKSD